MFVSKLVHFNMPSLNSQHSSKAEHCNFEKKKSSASPLKLITVSKKFYRREQQSPFGHTIWHWSYIISRKPFKAQHACLSCPVKKAKVELPSWHGLCCYYCHCSNVSLRNCTIMLHAQCNMMVFFASHSAVKCQKSSFF